MSDREFPSPLQVVVRGPALRPERGRPADRRLDIDVTQAGTVRLFVMGGESTWLDLSPAAAEQLAGRLALALEALDGDRVDVPVEHTGRTARDGKDLYERLRTEDGWR